MEFEELLGSPVTTRTRHVSTFEAEAMLTHIKFADKQMKFKRRWLMGLPTTKYESEDQQTESLTFLQNSCLQESLLREDDVFYETLKNHVENAFDIPNIKSDCSNIQESPEDLDVSCSSKELRSRLDDVSNTGLYLLASHFTKSYTQVDKTRWKLKKSVLKYLQRMKKCEANHHFEECVELSHVVAHPSFFRRGCAASFNLRYQSNSAKVRWVLGNLKNYPSQVLLSMYRKLKGESGKMLQVENRRSGWNRGRLIDRVNRICESRLAEQECDELSESIAKAMAVTTLSMNLAPGIQNQGFADFYQFLPEIVTLQNNITKAILLINEKVRVSELRELQVLLGLNANLPIKGLRSAIRNLLTVYLFECDDMDVIPKYLSDTLAIINRSSRNVPHKCFPKDEINNDLECILGVGASAKQVLLDLLPDYNYDQQFTDAYIEDLQESESDESDTDDSLKFEFDQLPNNMSHMDDSAESVESFGDSNFIEENVSDADPTLSCSNTSTNVGGATERTEANPDFWRDNLQPMDSAVTDANEELDRSKQTGSNNKYLRVQEACDESSLFAYKCIGQVLSKCARFQGFDLNPVDISYLNDGDSHQLPDATKKQAADCDDVGGQFICQVVEDLFHNIPNSVKKKLEDLMSML